MSFKLLALRATSKFPYLKNLQPHNLYKFTSDYEFEGNDNEKGHYSKITRIKNRRTYPQSLYDLKMANGKPLSLNISAVLGKNGSGKSSLLELLYLLVYCFAENEGFLNERKFNQRHAERGYTNRSFNSYQKQVEKLLADTAIEAYYEIDNNFYVLVQSDGLPGFYQLESGDWVPKDYKSKHFFYSIVVNYSLYGLNEKGNYFWLHPLFHKNDGYKTPLVLNPFRDAGVIDVNSELHLAQSRVLTNLVDKRFETGQIIDDRVMSSVTFDVYPERIGWVEKLTTREILDLTKDAGGGDLQEVFKEFIKQYTGIDEKQVQRLIDYMLVNFRMTINDEKVRTNNPRRDATRVEYSIILELLGEYILTKIAKICGRYDEFIGCTKEVLRPEAEKSYIRVISDNELAVEQLLSNSSHVTLKLKQAVNAYVHHYFDNAHWTIVPHPDDPELRIYRYIMPVKSLTDMINSAIGNIKGQAIYYIPAAMFRPSLELAGPRGNSSFPQLSSGEQQILNSIHCILYHLLNIDSLEIATASYPNVNIVLDEIELYYHPEYQRRFIGMLRDYLEKLSLDTVKNLNIIFSTHSPFILSDIPQQNVLKLEKGYMQSPDAEEKTFGANIHEMLARSFFLNKELIGDFAKKHIEETVKRLNEAEQWHVERQNKNNTEASARYEEARTNELLTRELLQRIEIIGERVISLKLKEMYRHTFEIESEEKEEALREIQKLIKKFNFNKKDI